MWTEVDDGKGEKDEMAKSSDDGGSGKETGGDMKEGTGGKGDSFESADSLTEPVKFDDESTEPTSDEPWSPSRR